MCSAGQSSAVMGSMSAPEYKEAVRFQYEMNLGPLRSEWYYSIGSHLLRWCTILVYCGSMRHRALTVLLWYWNDRSTILQRDSCEGSSYDQGRLLFHGLHTRSVAVTRFRQACTDSQLLIAAAPYFTVRGHAQIITLCQYTAPSGE